MPLSNDHRLRVLWVDDDGPKRFRVERVIIEEDFKSHLDWAETIEAAVTLLRDHSYAAIILDQMLTGPNTPMTHVPWAGCALLYWLLGNTERPWGDDDVWPTLRSVRPHPSNAGAAIIFVSGLADDDLWNTAKEASPGLTLLRKPLTPADLVNFLNSHLRTER